MKWKPFKRDTDQAAADATKNMKRMDAVVEINAPPSLVFDLWAQLEGLPRVLDGVRRVKRISDTRTLWDVDVAGRQVLWEAETTAFEPNKRIAWESRWGKRNAGELRFYRTIDGHTRLSVLIEFETNTFFERIAARFNLIGEQVKSDLSLFRRYVEEDANGASNRLAS
jgi:uncharacterized membrane protein